MCMAVVSLCAASLYQLGLHTGTYGVSYPHFLEDEFLCAKLIQWLHVSFITHHSTSPHSTSHDLPSHHLPSHHITPPSFTLISPWGCDPSLLCNTQASCCPFWIGCTNISCKKCTFPLQLPLCWSQHQNLHNRYWSALTLAHIHRSHAHQWRHH